MEVNIISSETLGTRSLATLVKCEDINILIDPGVALGPRFGLMPHELEYRELYNARKKIEEISKFIDLVCITHYHYDHYTPFWEKIDNLWTFASSESATKIYSNKVVYLKDFYNNINYSQRERAKEFIPKFPARIHADEKLKFAVISSEFTPHPALDREIGLAICKWAIKHGINKILTIEGILEEKDLEEVGKVWVVGSTSKSMEDIKKAELPVLEYGAIMGIPAIILNECKFLNVDAYCFITKVHHTHPEFKASAIVLEMINKLFPDISLDPKPLYAEAEKIEKKLREVREHIKPVETSSGLFYR